MMMVGEWAYADHTWQPGVGTPEEAYTEFVRARHSVWEKRNLGLPSPWTSDQIVSTRKFTNVFRILDRGSQFLYGHLMQDTTFHTALFRAFLYRYTNLPKPWVAFEEEWGYSPTWEDARDGTLLAFWQAYREQGQQIFGQAYRIFSGLEKGTDRLTWAVNMARDWVTPDFSSRFEGLPHNWERAKMLQTIPRCAGFMSMQVLTDMSYLQGWDENDFVIAGPGAIQGIRNLTAEWDKVPQPGDVMRTLTSYWQRDGGVTLNGRPPSLMDVQNTLCEFSKYSRWTPGSKPYEPVGLQQPPSLPEHYEGII